MKKLTYNQIQFQLGLFEEEIEGDWDSETIEMVFAHVLDATYLKTISLGQHDQTDEKEHDVYLMVFKNPQVILTNSQLIQILGYKSHIIFEATIIYEDEFCYITWSNLALIKTLNNLKS